MSDYVDYGDFKLELLIEAMIREGRKIMAKDNGER